MARRTANSLFLLITFGIVFALGMVGIAQEGSIATVSDADSTKNAPASEVDPQPSADPQSDHVDGESSGSFWMEQKLRFSKEILTGLAMADFNKINKHAELMQGLNRVEAFVRREPAGYRDQLRQFNYASRSLRRAAKDRNIEAATLAFNQLTISCVSCHKHLRESK